jgi:hypothetical protein
MADANDFLRMQQMQQQLASMQTPLSQQPTRLLGVFGDVQFTSFKMPSPNIFDKKLQWGRGRQPSKFMSELGFTADGIMDGLRKCAQAGPVVSCSPNDIFGHGLDRIGPSIHEPVRS